MELSAWRVHVRCLPAYFENFFRAKFNYCEALVFLIIVNFPKIITVSNISQKLTHDTKHIRNN